MYSWCPSTLVISKLYVPLVGCYRQLLGSAFMKARSGSILPRKELYCSHAVYIHVVDYVNKPALGVFLRVIDQPDIMDATLVSTNGYWYEIQCMFYRHYGLLHLKMLKDPIG